MVLAMPVLHPARHGTVLLSAGIELDDKSVSRLGEVGPAEVWIEYPRLDDVARCVHPAVTIARGFSDTFAGINPANVAAFVAVQLVAAALATWFFAWLLAGEDAKAE